MKTYLELLHRLEAIKAGIKELREAEDKRRATAGPQQPSDRDITACWQGKYLPLIKGSSK